MISSSRTDRFLPRARGTTQYAQEKSHPSWIFRNVRLCPSSRSAAYSDRSTGFPAPFPETSRRIPARPPSPLSCDFRGSVPTQWSASGTFPLSKGDTCA